MHTDTEFTSLVNRRKNLVNEIKINNYKGNDVISDLYTKSEHFIYELLQNTEDTKASYVEFRIFPNRLKLIHDGRPFDYKDIESITNVGNSTKTDINNVGKFGIGFKSVYTITQTPHIISGQYNFKIKDYLIPEPQEGDTKEQIKTTITLPFEHKFRSEESLYKIVQEKLTSIKLINLLFLKNIKRITINNNGELTIYSREFKVIRTGNINVYNISLIASGFNYLRDKIEEYLIFDKETIINNVKYKVEIAYKLDNKKIVPVNSSKLFVFFETEQNTHLKFLMQGPYQTSKTRENIPFDEDNNILLLRTTNDLVNESILILKEMNLLDLNFFHKVLPLEDPKIYDKGEIYNSIFYSVKSLLYSNKYDLLPVSNNNFDNINNTVIARGSRFFNNLLSKEQLFELYKKSSFIDFEVRETGDYKELYEYFVNQLRLDVIRPESFCEKLSKSFFEKQSDEWIIKFYQRISEVNFLWRSFPYPKGLLRYKEIIRTENNTHISPFDNQDEPRVYLPIDNTSKYNSVKMSIYQNESVKKFLKDLGLSTPDLFTEIKEEILPKYKDDTDTIDCSLEDLKNDFIKIMQGYKSFNFDKKNALIQELKNVSFLLVKDPSTNEESFVIDEPLSLYIETPDLVDFFEYDDYICFVDKDFYRDLVNIDDLNSFFQELSLNSIPRIIDYENNLDYNFKEKLRNNTEYPREEEINDITLEGLDKLLENIDQDKSYILWSYLLKHLSNGENLFQAKYSWKNPRERRKREEFFESRLSKCLKENYWLYDEKGNKFRSSEITYKELSSNYEKNELVNQLVKLLDFKPDFILEDLPETIKEKIQTASLFEKFLNQGLSIDKIQSVLNKALNQEIMNNKVIDNNNICNLFENKEELIFNLENNYPIIETQLNNNSKEKIINNLDRLELKKEKLENEIESQEKINLLRDEICNLENNSKKYSFLWFKKVLELEYQLSNIENSRTKEIKIYFSDYEIHSKEFIILKYPSRKVPNYIEDLSDLNLKIVLGDKTINTTIDVVNVKDNSIKVKIKKNIEENINNFRYAEVEVKNVLFLLEELIKEFENLDLNEDDNIKEILPKALEFVFGPPGTGKTTYLANFISDSMNKNSNINILVLTPTNKASDVLTRKIYQKYDSPPNWLIRFGSTGDENIENLNITKDKSFNINSNSKNVVISTIARIPYDGFYSQSLKDFKWDIIIFDESSMINLASILYSIYKQRDSCKRFIIAGDPFQIPPITLAQEWKDENIYTLVELNDFEKKETTHNQYPIISLTTQYRSIPSIGTLFSNYSYKGLLSHYRKREEKKELIFGGKILNDINIIEFPVEKYNKLYKSHKIDGSSYHIYSSILIVELVLHLKNEIKEKWDKKNILNTLESKIDYFNLEELNKNTWTIGIICPYKAQSLIIGKILDEIYNETDISVIADTVHGFQGDECDIIITVLNPPNSINSKIFLNNQNILNVAISRARDYLIILSPDRKTDNFNYLVEPNRLLNIISSDLKDFYNNTNSKNIENIIFKKNNFISENTFITSHQKVNVYSNHNHRYEFRTKEGSIDGDTVDIHLNIQEDLNNEKK